MNTTPEPQRTPLDAQMHDLATGLRDVILGTDETYLEQDPEDGYTDLASRLVLQLARRGLTICPMAQLELPAIRNAQAEAAARTFDILTKWMSKHPEYTYVTDTDVTGTKFSVTLHESAASRSLSTPDHKQQVRGFFQGLSIQDAYAQAAQTILGNGGEL